MYEKGRGVPKDIVKALQFYKQSADTGDTLAQVQVGTSKLPPN